MKILGIETSCDETALCIIEANERTNTLRVLGNTVHSQIDVHASYGGVFPTLAKREHSRNLISVFERTLCETGLLEKESDPVPVASHTLDLLSREPELKASFKEFIPTLKRPDLDYLSVTVGPGLEPALWVGIQFAKALSKHWDIPIVPANHMEGHILTGLIEGKAGIYSMRKVKFPALSLLISGGHTQLVLMKEIGSYEIAGETLDDAIGECFDKTARTLGLPYPGGPKIAKLAAEARKKDIQSPEPLPRPMIQSPTLDFSFSGLKTAVLYLVQRLKKNSPTLDSDMIRGISREIEESVTDVVVAKVKKAAETYGIETIIVGGGVIANEFLRTSLEDAARELGLSVMVPQVDHSTDNGLMIAIAGYINRSKAVQWSAELKANGTLPLGIRA